MRHPRWPVSLKTDPPNPNPNSNPPPPPDSPPVPPEVRERGLRARNGTRQFVGHCNLEPSPNGMKGPEWAAAITFFKKKRPAGPREKGAPSYHF